MRKHNLPHKAVIELGPIKLDLNVEPMLGEFGDFIGAAVLWGISTQQTIEALRKAQEAQRAGHRAFERQSADGGHGHA